MPKTPRPAPFLAAYLPDGLRLETAIARACAEGDAAIRAGSSVHDAARAVEIRLLGLARAAFCWGRRGAEIRASDPDAHAAYAEAARLDAEAAERADREAEADGTPVRRVSCGCCTNGCVCWNHMDIPAGLPPRKCSKHNAANAAERTGD